MDASSPKKKKIYGREFRPEAYSLRKKEAVTNMDGHAPGCTKDAPATEFQLLVLCCFCCKVLLLYYSRKEQQSPVVRKQVITERTRAERGGYGGTRGRRDRRERAALNEMAAARVSTALQLHRPKLFSRDSAC